MTWSQTGCGCVRPLACPGALRCCSSAPLNHLVNLWTTCDDVTSVVSTGSLLPFKVFQNSTFSTVFLNLLIPKLTSDSFQTYQFSFMRPFVGIISTSVLSMSPSYVSQASKVVLKYKVLLRPYFLFTLETRRRQKTATGHDKELVVKASNTPLL